MNYLKSINRYIYRLTGHDNFIISEQKSDNYHIACIYDYHLHVVGASDWDYRAFHEFCHFIDANDYNLLLPDFGLELNSKDSWIREYKVSMIEESLKRNKVFMSYIKDSHMCRKTTNKYILPSSEQVEKTIVHNISMVKRFSGLIKTNA